MVVELALPTQNMTRRQYPEVATPQEHPFVLQTPAEYVQDVLNRLPTAEERAYFLTMAYSPDPEIVNCITHALSERTASKGIHAIWASDRYSDLIFRELPLPNLFHPVRYRRWKKELEKETNLMRSSGVDVRWLNDPKGIEKVVPFSGRNHAKMAIIDKTAWVQGPNTTDPGFSQNHDWVLRVNDPAVVAPMADVFFDIVSGDLRRKGEDKIIPAGDSTILVDAGKRGSSVILDAAVQAIEGATVSIYGSSQFTPEGPVLEALFRAAERGVMVNFHTNDPRQLGYAYRAMEEYHKIQKKLEIDRRDDQRIIRRERGPLIHAKGLLIDEAIAMFTSHNLNKQGPEAGTIEFALMTQVQANFRELFRSNLVGNCSVIH